MAINFNDTTPAAAAGGVNVKWQTDGAGNDSAYVPSAGFTKAVVVFTAGVNTNAQIILSAALGIGIKFPASAPSSVANAKVAATSSTTYTLKKNGSSFCTVNFAGSATTGTFTQASDATFTATDILEIDGPGTADATLAGVSITLVGITT